jgi:hypothetical protein
MENKRQISDKESQDKTEVFRKSVDLCKIVFGELTGHRWVREDEDIMSGYISPNFNDGILDAQMYGFVEYSKHDMMPKAQIVKDAYIDLVCTNSFADTVELGTYSTKNTKKRMEKWLARLRDVVDYPSDDHRFYTFEEKQLLLSRKDGNVCKLCKNQIMEIDDAHVDHIERFVEGGKTTIKNAQITHRFCNLEKG